MTPNIYKNIKSTKDSLIVAELGINHIAAWLDSSLTKADYKVALVRTKLELDRVKEQYDKLMAAIEESM